jgi:N-acetylneuraminic acid mutarotase
VDANEEYDPAADRWRPRRPIPTPRSGVAGAVLANRAYVFGGEQPSGTFRENEEYDPVADTWTARAPMSAGRHGLAAATVGDAIYVLAGGPTPGGSQIGTNEAFSFN